MTVDQAGAAVTVSSRSFSAIPGLTEKVSARKRKVSAKRKPKRLREDKSAETLTGLQVNVDDGTLLRLIAAGRVGVHKNGSRQKKHGNVYDYRSHYRALRLNSRGREVLAFGTPDRLTEKLAQIGVVLCFDHSRPVLTMGSHCQQCESRGEEGASCFRFNMM